MWMITNTKLSLCIKSQIKDRAIKPRISQQNSTRCSSTALQYSPLISARQCRFRSRRVVVPRSALGTSLKCAHRSKRWVSRTKWGPSSKEILTNSMSQDQSRKLNRAVWLSTRVHKSFLNNVTSGNRSRTASPHTPNIVSHPRTDNRNPPSSQMVWRVLPA